MVEFFLIWLPIIAAILMPILLRAKKIWAAFIIVLFTYLTAFLISVITLTMRAMMVEGESDPALVSGQIAERLVSSVLTSVIVIPLALLLFVGWRKLKEESGKGSD